MSGLSTKVRARHSPLTLYHEHLPFRVELLQWAALEQFLYLVQAQALHTPLHIYMGTKSGTICTKSSSTSVSWTPPLDLAHMVPNATSGVGTLYCDTYNGNTKIGSKSISFTCNVPASVKPSCSISSLTNTNSTFGCYAKLLSGVKVKPSASGSYSSTISSLKISVTGMSDKTASSGTEYTFDPFTSTGEKR